MNFFSTLMEKRTNTPLLLTDQLTPTVFSPANRGELFANEPHTRTDMGCMCGKAGTAQLHNDTNGSLFASGVLPFFLTARLLVFGVHIQLRRMIWVENKRIEVCAISQIRFCVKQNLF